MTAHRPHFDPELSKRISKTGVEKLAKMLAEVQPLGDSNNGISENEGDEWIFADVYLPACPQTNLMWVKND